MPENSAKVSFQIHQVADLLELPAGTIRNWQDRYGFLSEASGRGSYRRIYSLSELLKIDSVKRLIQAGGKPRVLCKLSAAELQQQVRELKFESLEKEKSILFEALRVKDFDTFEACLKKLSFSSVACEALIEPLLFEIGAAWHRGDCTIAEEHLFSGALRRWVMVTHSEPRTVRRRIEVVVGALGPDLHEGAILLMSAILRKEGVRVNYLGPNIPSLEVVRTDQGKTRRVYLLSSAVSTKNFVQEVEALVGMKSIVIIGGASVENSFPGDGFHGVLTLNHFSASRFATILAQAIRLGFIQP